MCVDAGGVRVCVTHLDSRGKQGEQAQQMENVLAGYAHAGVRTLLAGDGNLECGGSPNAQDFVPAGMFRKGDGDVQHVMATQRHFGFVSTRRMRLNWIDHPGFRCISTSAGWRLTRAAARSPRGSAPRARDGRS